MISWQSLQSNFSIQPFHPATKFPFDFHSSYLDRKKEIKRRKRKNDRVPTVSGYLCKIIAHLEPLAAIVSVWSWSRRRVQTERCLPRRRLRWPAIIRPGFTTVKMRCRFILIRGDNCCGFDVSRTRSRCESYFITVFKMVVDLSVLLFFFFDQ